MRSNHRASTGTLVLLACLVCVFLACSEQSLFPEGTGTELENIGGQNLWTPLEAGVQIEPYQRIGDEVFCGDIHPEATPMSNIDVSTFEVWPESGYARDSLHVYYPIETRQFAVDDTLLVRECTRYIVDGVKQPFNFRYLGRGYGTDNQNLFLRGRLIEGV